MVHRQACPSRTWASSVGRAAGCCALVACGAELAQAQMTFTAQKREVSAWAGVGSSGNQASKSAPDFAPFIEGVQAEYKHFEGTNIGYAQQDSRLEAAAIFNSGVVGGQDTYGSGGAGSGVGTSTLVVGFSLSAPSPFEFWLSGIDGWHPPSSGGTVGLTGPSGNVFAYSGGGPNWPYSTGVIHELGTLGPGQYTLTINLTNGWVGPSTGINEWTYDSWLVVPAPTSGWTLGVAGLALTRRRRG